MPRRCRILLALPFFVLLAPSRAVSQSDGQLYTASRGQLDVTKAILAQEAAWNAGDLDGYISHYKDAPDTQAVLGAPAVGLSSIRAAFHINFPNRDAMGTLEDTEVQVRELGPAFALATGRFHLTRNHKGGGNIDGTFADILEKTSVGWQIIFSEST